MPPHSRRSRVRRLVSKQHRSQELGASKPRTLLVGFYGPCRIHALSYHGPQKQRHPCPQPNFSLLQKRTTSPLPPAHGSQYAIGLRLLAIRAWEQSEGTMPSLLPVRDTPEAIMNHRLGACRRTKRHTSPTARRCCPRGGGKVHGIAATGVVRLTMSLQRPRRVVAPLLR